MTVMGPWLRLRQAQARITLLERRLALRVGEVAELRESLAAELARGRGLEVEVSRLRDLAAQLQTRRDELMRAQAHCETEHAKHARAQQLEEAGR